jgi:GNAT superfamily N-acetyltransferase
MDSFHTAALSTGDERAPVAQESPDRHPAGSGWHGCNRHDCNRHDWNRRDCNGHGCNGHDWNGRGCNGHDCIRVAALRRRDREAVLAMFARCSAGTLYRRFHGVTNGVFHAVELVERGDQDAYGAWSGDLCIGVASLADDDHGSTHIGVLVEDGWQRRGAGSALLTALVARARQRRLPALMADVLADNGFILPLLDRVGPTTSDFSYGGYRVNVAIEQGRRPGPPPRSAQPKPASRRDTCCRRQPTPDPANSSPTQGMDLE